ncbi:phosphoserine aminotransferase [Candidatus Roizmanbacteria bacterium CG03_land_8_20_14_0_80_39_12]|uniref:Phosphoserine aminotransferase n=1 Tax=Candidatus Roizmanbacteria bacterium CG03_land_8_20_14_0_80_39_12 TaxID=1974847 RepID=A0A2M7BRP3_9BACT|nr:MAG: phosphoserine aminotransferase [Candidatus Roizmanbacteria bacterium CG03_land_8_20_14_0_80_39_12]
MKKIYFTPGPSQIYPKLNLYIKEALSRDIMSLSHRSKDYVDIAQNTQHTLRKLLQIPSTHHIFFMSSSLESMERIIANCVKTQSFHLINGSFAEAFFNAAEAQGKKANILRFKPGERIDMDSVAIPKKTELICITQNETSNGSCIPMKDIYALKKRYPTIPIALDIVSSAPYPLVNFKKIDIAFFSVQKGFGLPSGLGILVVDDALVQKSKHRGYHDFPSLAQKELIFQTPETPNVLAIFLLGKVILDMINQGVGRMRKATEMKAKLIVEFINVHPDFGLLFITDTNVRSKTVLAIEVGNKVDVIIEKLKLKGFVVGKGYGIYKKTQIRIANFPQHSMRDFQRLIKEMGLILK